MKSKRIGVLMGGLSAEREVSIMTGEAVYRALSERGYSVARLYVDREIDQALRQNPIDVAFIALHGSYGEDGCIQGLLEILEIPYTGPGVTESALAMDKLKSKELFRLLNVPTPPYYAIDAEQIPDLEEIHGSFGFPVFAKPRRQGSSIGAGRADGLSGLAERCREAAQFDRSVLVERFVRGREVSVGILDGTALGVIEIVPPHGVYDYRAKYQKGQSQYFFPARLTPTRYRGVLRIAERAACAVGAESVARVDMLVTEGENEYVLEVNTLPGLTPTSLLPKIAAGAGYDFGDLCEAVLRGASLKIARGVQTDARALDCAPASSMGKDAALADTP